MYEKYKNVTFPKLLGDPSISEEDKRKIRDLLKKKWNPYVRRHTAATEISKALKDSVLIDQYMGWSHAGNTRQKYQHYYNDDSFDAMLTVMDGLQPTTAISSGKKRGLLKPRQCPNCEEPNTPETKFCIKCRYVLSYDAYNETIEEKEKAAKEAEETRKKLQQIGDVQDQLKNIQEQMQDLTHAFLVQSIKLHSPAILEQVKDKENKTSTEIIRELNKIGYTIVANESALFTREERRNGFAERHTLHFEEV
jgi:hypothetical protein